MTRSVTILGATGSIGQSTLDLIARSPERFRVEALTAATNVIDLAEAARRTGAKLAVIADDSLYGALKEALAGSGCEAASGMDALVEAASRTADLVIAAIVGCAGLRPVMAAVEAGRTIGLANKEALVTAGSLMTQAAATPDQAVAHPNWSMGAKISVDSATLMNKGLELIEAYHLFGLPSDRIDVIVHPQSIVHSMVEFIDGSMLAQMGPADMRVPIAHVLASPERMDTPVKRLDLAAIGLLEFAPPDLTRFPCLRIARDAMEQSGAAAIVLNAANEIAVAAFLDHRIQFSDIPATVEEALERSTARSPGSIDDVMEIDRQTRIKAEQMIRVMCH